MGNWSFSESLGDYYMIYIELHRYIYIYITHQEFLILHSSHTIGFGQQQLTFGSPSTSRVLATHPPLAVHVGLALESCGGWKPYRFYPAENMDLSENHVPQNPYWTCMNWPFLGGITHATSSNTLLSRCRFSTRNWRLTLPKHVVSPANIAGWPTNNEASTSDWDTY